MQAGTAGRTSAEDLIPSVFIVITIVLYTGEWQLHACDITAVSFVVWISMHLLQQKCVVMTISAKSIWTVW